MKTLDEVIKVFEDCFGDGRIVISPLEVEPDTGADALHYLKEYQTILPLLPSLINTAIEVQKKGKTIG